METYCCSNGIDRISSLPVDILHNILSNLCIFDVIHMTVLSKRWKYISTTIPYFRFDSSFSDSDPDHEEFKEFIDTFLISHKTINLVRFILSCSNMFESTDILRFIDAATRRNVEQLVLWFSPCEPFELPHCLDGEWRENYLKYQEWCDYWQMHDPEVSIVCLDSHLKSIQLIGFKDEENEIELIRFFLKNARVLEKFRIVCAGYALTSKEASKKVLNIPTTSSQVLLTFHDAKLKRWSDNWLDNC
ncbi:putative F-box/FBD/LRR-repeat protein At3g49030 [Solanum verrucosum]|uniref:putative F-box/FBD/LRR-repeat protein At3g49030 n=1 Tax=Solanum verrucosum TaxID=315347 RepID=UPI0020D0EB2C|nr:putative F-box/FBD/LRR-repeat protein At3g49030 [Solanum verrucosum]